MTALAAFRTHIGLLTWDDLVTGYDFGILTSREIQVEATGSGPAVRRLRGMTGIDLYDFEIHLWAASTEAVGRPPRPGSSRWALAQDRWRTALLREALTMDTTNRQIARTVERIYNLVGCPEDMLVMLKPAHPWSGAPATVDPIAIQQFLERCCLATRAVVSL